MTPDQERAIREVDASLRIYVLEDHRYGEIVRWQVRRDLEALRAAFPALELPSIEDEAP